MKIAICWVPCSPVRATSSHRSEMVSQLLFGERCQVLDETVKDWLKIKCVYDGYEGWCQSTQLKIVGEETTSIAFGLTSKWSTNINLGKQTMKLPLGSSIPIRKKDRAHLYGIDIDFDGKLWNPAKAKWNRKEVEEIAMLHINTAYLWGGKSVFGVDCSGYMQTVFRFFGIELLRDAWQQAGQGVPVDGLKNARFGDLAFFDNADGKVVHVGLILSHRRIIHSSGKVRIDKLNEQGIVNSENGSLTHTLRMIRRFN